MAERLDDLAGDCEGELEKLVARAPTTPIGMVYRAEVARLWLAATDRAISALQAWRARLTGAGGLVTRAELAQALELLDRAGLGEWAEWGAGLDLDGLAEGPQE